MSSPVSIMWWRNVFQRYGQGCIILMTLVLVVGFGWNQFGAANHGSQPSVNPDRVIMTVNGQKITEQQYGRAMGNNSSAPPGPQYASFQGQVLEQLVQSAVVQQLARSKGVKADPALIDQDIAQLRKNAGFQNKSDSDWDQYLEQSMGQSESDLRKSLANDPQILLPALVQYYKGQQSVAEADAKNQFTQVKLGTVFIRAGKPDVPQPGKKVQTLTDAQAKTKADALLAKAKSGANLQALARANSQDGSARMGGVTPLRPEYQDMSAMGPMGATMGSLGFGPDFDSAVHSTPVGGFTPVIKATGFQQGYVFAKVLDRKTNLPKDFNAQKQEDQIRSTRAQAALRSDITRLFTSANVQVLDPDLKPYYDYYKMTQMPMEQMPQSVNGQGFNPADFAKKYQQQQKTVDAEFADLLKRHPDDPTAAMMVADAIKTRERFAKGTTPAQNDAYRDQLISLYKTVLKSTEDRDTRFQLADLLAEKKDKAAAEDQYATIAKYMAEDPPYDLGSYQTYQTDYQRLATAFTRLGDAKQASEMTAKAVALAPRIKEAQAQQAAASKAAAAHAAPSGAPASAAAAPGAAAGGSAPAAPVGKAATNSKPGGKQ